MADVHIKSEGQSGGITAQNVSYGTQLPPQNQSNRAKAIFWWIVGIAGVISAVAGVVQILK